MNPTELWLCEKVYRTGAGGYWQAMMVFFLVLLVAGMTAYIIVAGRINLAEHPLYVAMPGALCLPVALFALSAFLRERNSKVGICYGGVLVQDWLGRREFVAWENIAALIQLTTWGSGLAPSRRHRLAMRVIGDRGRVSTLRLAYVTPGSAPQVYDEWAGLRDEIIKRRNLLFDPDESVGHEIEPENKGAWTSERRVWK